MTVEITTLKNGLRVVTETLPHVETASLGVWVDVGARYETRELHGVSHLLEHMVFKGTKGRSAAKIATAIEDVGGHLNAFTSREHTTYYAKVMKGDLALAADLLGDLIQNPAFAQQELKREQEVILQEIGQVKDTPDDLVFDHLQETAFPDQPLGQSILGTEQTVPSFTPATLQRHMAHHYAAPEMVLAGAGKLAHGDVAALAEEHFSALAPKNGADFGKARYRGGEKRDPRELEQLHLALGFQSCSYFDADYYATQVFATILGGGMSSRLFQEIREKRGYAYSVYAFNASLADTGLLSIYAGTGPEFARDLLLIAAREMQSLAGKIPAEEIARAKTQLKSGLFMSLESTSARMEQIGRQMLIFGKSIPVSELVEKVEAVDEASVNRVAKRLLASPLSFAGIGEVSVLPDYEGIAKLFRA
ncbi:MAG TPA: pitrilysin family protein [Sphingomonadales bacterium]|nr:pitrilysin family protein [Sphingomonadales bacterium]